VTDRKENLLQIMENIDAYHGLAVHNVKVIILINANHTFEIFFTIKKSLQEMFLKMKSTSHCICVRYHLKLIKATTFSVNIKYLIIIVILYYILFQQYHPLLIIKKSFQHETIVYTETAYPCFTFEE
jgi:hypothetical protein